MSNPIIENYNQVSRVMNVSSCLDPILLKTCDKFGPMLTLEALTQRVGSWFAQQDQSVINANGFTQRELMHRMCDFYFDLELRTAEDNKETIDATVRGS